LGQPTRFRFFEEVICKGKGDRGDVVRVERRFVETVEEEIEEESKKGVEERVEDIVDVEISDKKVEEIIEKIDFLWRCLFFLRSKSMYRLKSLSVTNASLSTHLDPVSYCTYYW
jgi:hypothetical protein